MKKILLLSIMILFIQPLFSQAIINTPSDLDTLWSDYLENGNLDAVTEIIKVLEWDDFFRGEINAYLQNKENDSIRLIELLNGLSFDLSPEQDQITDKVNVGAVSFILLPDEKFGPMVKEIAGIVGSSRTTLEQMMILGSATWSLKSNSQQHSEVKEHILSIYDDLDISTQFMIDHIILGMD